MRISPNQTGSIKPDFTPTAFVCRGDGNPIAASIYDEYFYSSNLYQVLFYNDLNGPVVGGVLIFIEPEYSS